MVEIRVIRAPLPAELIRRIDSLIESGSGAYQTRGEVIRDAVEALVLEYEYGVADSSSARPSAAGEEAFGTGTTRRATERDGRTGFAQSNLPPLGVPPQCELVMAGDAVVVDECLFGLHNRDYPTLWAARRLADYTTDGPLDLDAYYVRVAQDAWTHGAQLRAVEGRLGKRLTALFPTNEAKRESAEGAFLNFAIGSCVETDGRLVAVGPLFTWKLAQVSKRNGQLELALTPDGHRLVASLADLTVEPPHDREHARTFFGHLRDVSPADWSGFGETLQTLKGAVTRRELVESFTKSHPDWTQAVAATNAAGYVARSREWGLVAPRQDSGRYVLTEFGFEMLETLWEADDGKH